MNLKKNSGDVVDNQTGLSSNSTVAWRNLPQAQRIQILNIWDNFINTNPPVNINKKNNSIDVLNHI
ncbi:hypothetical protein C3L50_00720 [Flavobacterium alvei]|uniref:Uncharacterized protein n=1 Tax=Flavobacterium alvei TaxID=2080416 RepID=A0A2S5AET0_9FLAO|nr:hypothetical protein [Flavobacterium alvei]POY41084.1 hypothetical protein C3L50_00720 [Flavobacterium alvei]